MSFQAYLDTIERKTGLDAAGLRRWADEQGFVADGTLAPAIKPMQVVAAAKEQLGLGHGHAMAIVGLLKHHPNAPTGDGQ
jgi:hypothetical protein